MKQAIIETKDNDRTVAIANLAGMATNKLNSSISEIEARNESGITRYVEVKINNGLIYGSETFLLARKIHQLITGQKNVTNSNLCVSIKKNTYKLVITLDRTKT